MRNYIGRYSVNGVFMPGVYSSNNLNQLIKDLRRLAEYNNPSFFYDSVTVEVFDRNGLEVCYGRKNRCCKRFNWLEL